MSESCCDVLIVGGGPAGLAAAITCAAQGLATRLLTKPPRLAGACAPLQSLHPRAEGLLRDLGATAVLDGAAVMRFEKILNGMVEQPFSRYAGVQLYGFHVDRERFDALLLEHAQRVGVQLVDYAAVTDVMEQGGRIRAVTTRQGKQWSARWFIDASGYTRALSRRLNSAQRVVSPQLIVASGVISHDGVESNATRFVARAEGWCWYTPGLDGWRTWTALQSRTVQRSPEVAALVQRSIPGSIRLANATWCLTRPLACKGVLTVGDAAGRLDPAAGIGVVEAMESGIMAGQAIVDSCLVPHMSAIFQAVYDDWFVERFDANARQLHDFYLAQRIALLD